MNPGYLDHLNRELELLKEAGLYKTERVITTPQQPRLTANGRQVVCLCANNYLGLANHPAVIAAAKGGSWTATASAWRRCASSVAPRTSTGSWS